MSESDVEWVDTLPIRVWLEQMKVSHKELAKALGIRNTSLSRKLSRKIRKEERSAIITVIKQLEEKKRVAGSTANKEEKNV